MNSTRTDKNIQPKNSLENVLHHYFKVLRGKKLSNSKKSLHIPADDQKNLKDMWEEHERVRRIYGRIHGDMIHYSHGSSVKRPFFSYLDLKIKIANQIFENCTFCERRCGVNRNKEPGYCGVQDARIASEFLHMGEETPLVPSHTVFFTGCSFQCVYCQNWDISQHPKDGMVLSEQKLANIIDRRKSEGSRNVNFVGGDPNPQILFILKAACLMESNLPLIWNSNFYMSTSGMKLLDGVVDLYLTDFKYGNNHCALKLSNAPNYWETVTRNHKMAQDSGDMIIRHLVLPNHLKCCTKPILEWIYHNLGKETVLNIMGQYRPVYGACALEDISRFLYSKEMEQAMHYAENLGFVNLI